MEFDLQNPNIDPVFKKVLNQNTFQIISRLSPNAPATADFDTVFIAEKAYIVVSISEVRTANPTAGTLQVQKCASGVANGSGVNLLATAFDLTTTVNIPQFGILTNTKVDLILKKDDRLTLTIPTSTTFSSTRNVHVTIILRAI